MMRTRRIISAATTFLIRSFAPGCPTMLRSWSSKPERVPDGGRHERVERLTITYDLPTVEAHRRARELERSARSLLHVAIGRTSIRYLTVEVSARHSTMVVDALLGRDPQHFAGRSNRQGASHG